VTSPARSFAVAALACLLPLARGSAQTPSRYLYVWAGPSDSVATSHVAHAGHTAGTTTTAPSDFLAVIDLRPDAPNGRYGRMIATVPVGVSRSVPHHAEQDFVAGRRWFASGFGGGQLFLFDAHDRARPRLAGRVDSVPGLQQPHSLARLPNGHVVATVQFGPRGVPGRPGGLVELDDDGRVVRTASAADPAFPTAAVRSYGITVAPQVDRIVTTSSPMDTERVADVVQIWRASDLTLLNTIELPPRADSAHRDPFEVRTLADGRSVMLNTWRCSFWRVADLETASPRVELVLSAKPSPDAGDGCAVPVVVGDWWIMPIAYQHRVVVLDVSRPERPRIVSSLATDSTFFPHWSAADPASDRIVITEQGDGAPRVLMARLDRRTGQLTWDERFRDAGATRPGLDFARVALPGGTRGSAMPHAAVFVPER
jgi:hypothetical protein